jgi:hypothetical protein
MAFSKARERDPWAGDDVDRERTNQTIVEKEKGRDDI